nr:hypothetical protein [Tanacetum cinerariifolium]
MLRLCHLLIAHGIDGRSQAPEKVIVTDLFYLRGMDVGSVNIPYLLICEELDDTWAWVASRTEKKQVAMAGALKVVEGAPDVNKGDQVVLAPVQAPQPHAVGLARTMALRLARLEEDVHGVRGALVIMEYLVKISKMARILELKRRNMKKLFGHPIRRIHQGRYSVFVPTSQETTKT